MGNRLDFTSLPAGLVALVLLAPFGCARDSEMPGAAQQTTNGGATGATVEKIREVLGGNARTEQERNRDVYRHPVETLSFFGLRDSMRVVELWPRGGYYTAILAPLLAENGRLSVTHFDPNGDPTWVNTTDAKRLLDRMSKSPTAFGKVEPIQLTEPNFVFGPDGSADMVVTFRNIHNWIAEDYADKVFAAAARVLERGGILGVEEHRGNPGMSLKRIKESGYVPEDMVIALATAAGLTLDARSEINANPKDTKDYPNGVWSLPPTFAEKEVNHDKYAAIGESDRMTLRFVKR